jgi:hypothetical protein
VKSIPLRENNRTSSPLLWSWISIEEIAELGAVIGEYGERGTPLSN